MSTSTGRRRAQRNVLCIHYAAGYCWEGDACRFRHDMNAAIIDVGMCWEWERTGECKKRNCRYRHDFARDAQITDTMIRNRFEAMPNRLVSFTLPVTPAVATTSAAPSRLSARRVAPRAERGVSPESSGPVTGSTRSNAPWHFDVVTRRSAAAASRSSPGVETTTSRPPSIAAAPPVSIRAVQTSLVRTTTPPSRPRAPVNVPATLPPNRTTTTPVLPESEVQCGICFEEPYIFGLLSGCSHVFCWKCIDGWRKSQNAGSKNCPMCRTPSAHHVLSELFLPDGDAQKRLLVQVAMNADSRTVAVPCGCGRTHINVPQAQVPSRPRPAPIQIDAYVHLPTPSAPAVQNGRTIAPVRTTAAAAAPSQAASTSRLIVGSATRAAAPPILMQTPSTSTATSRYGTATPATGYTRPTTNRVEIVRRGDAERGNEQTTAGWVIGLAAAAAVGVYRLWFSGG